ncbi:DUF4145 domain-containing protein [Burkholderia gladioli]|uniref:DUF4145 domain-containing protein n=1 Tax=Burkholderia gladioli TaxID=28095 RepID=UPI00163EB59C|nr:DUF4145 domain-containing protein [Burkholderia gladioli]
MPTLVHDCPHCGATKAAFTIPYSERNPTSGSLWNALGVCPACGYPAAIVAHTHPGQPIHNLTNLQGALKVGPHHNFFRISIFPSPEKIDTPEHIPPNAARAFAEGADSLAGGRATAAAAMFRRCLEIALKQHSPDIEAWKLEKRIDKLFAEGRITKDLQEWAHRIRLEGNDALHEEEEFTKQTAGEMMEFTRMVLVYLYTLPERIRIRVAAADAAKAD